MIEYIHQLKDWMLDFAKPENKHIASHALFWLAFAESSFFPIPPDILLIALALVNVKLSMFYASLCLVASVLGGVFGFFIGKYGGRPILEKFVSKAKIEAVEKLFKKYDYWAISIAGFTPIPYKVFTIASGTFKIKLKNFVIASILGRGGRFYLVAGLIYFFGDKVKTIIGKYTNIISIAFVILVAAGYWAMVKITKHKPKESEI